MGRIRGFELLRRDELVFVCDEPLASMYKLSPSVWKEGARVHLLLRVVNRSETASEKVARIHYGSSTDGLTFKLEDMPAIAPGKNPNDYDNGGCEDPTLADVNDTYYVYYTGWNEHAKRGELLLAAGPNVWLLEKRGVALEHSGSVANPKEATIVYAADGTWRLFFEYAHENKSKIGLARSQNVDGPWEILEPLFHARPDSWDSWHLSTGPILHVAGSPVMFYNGATQDAHWRIGWVVFNDDYTEVVARSEDPLVIPKIKRDADDTDIAFAASALEMGDEIHLYYSVADRYCVRAIVKRK